MTAATADVLVIGAGVIGCSVAYYTARTGRQVVLVDRADVAGGTSGACDGFVAQQTKSPGIHLEMARQSLRLYQGLADELGCDIEFRREGSMLLIESEAEAEGMQAIVARQRESGLAVQVLDRRQTLDLQPCLSPHIFGSTFCPEDGVVNPMLLALGLARAARRLGARVIPGAPVTAIRRGADGTLAVVTGAGTITARTVVNAAGPYGGEIAAMLGVAVPITPRRGQLAVTAPTRRMVRGGILHARYFDVKYHARQAGEGPSLAERLGLTFGVEQTSRGNLVINNTREFAGFDRRTTREAIAAVLHNALRYIPALRELRVIRTFAGLRPYTPDGLPVLGPVAGVPGFIMAAGHEGDGIALAPITGYLVAQLIESGQVPPLMQPFTPDRFTPRTA